MHRNRMESVMAEVLITFHLLWPPVKCTGPLPSFFMGAIRPTVAVHVLKELWQESISGFLAKEFIAGIKEMSAMCRVYILARVHRIMAVMEYREHLCTGGAIQTERH